MGDIVGVMWVFCATLSSPVSLPPGAEPHIRVPQASRPSVSSPSLSRPRALRPPRWQREFALAQLSGTGVVRVLMSMTGELQDAGGTAKNLVSRRVRLVGLAKRPELNGSEGVIEQNFA